MKISTVLGLCTYLHLYAPLITLTTKKKKIIKHASNLQPLPLLQNMWPLSWKAAMSQKLLFLNIFRATAPCSWHPDPQGHFRLTRHCCRKQADCLRGCSLWLVSTGNVVITEHYSCSQILKKQFRHSFYFFTKKNVFTCWTKNVQCHNKQVTLSKGWR